jgi:hypothetical protein
LAYLKLGKQKRKNFTVLHVKPVQSEKIWAHSPLVNYVSAHQAVLRHGPSTRWSTHVLASPRTRPLSGLGLGIVLFPLGRIWACSSLSIHHDRMTILHFWMNKTRTNSLHQTPVHFISPSLRSLYCMRRMSKPRLDRWARWGIEESSALWDSGVGGTTMGPFTDARTRWWVDVPPSSGSTVVPYYMPPPESWQAPSPWTPRPGGRIGASVSRGFIPNPLASKSMGDGGAPMC